MMTTAQKQLIVISKSSDFYFWIAHFFNRRKFQLYFFLLKKAFYILIFKKKTLPFAIICLLFVRNCKRYKYLSKYLVSAHKSSPHKIWNTWEQSIYSYVFLKTVWSTYPIRDI